MFTPAYFLVANEKLVITQQKEIYFELPFCIALHMILEMPISSYDNAHVDS